MTYQIHGLPAEPFQSLFEMADEALAKREARRTIADGPGFPCRISLEEAEPGEVVVLVNHVSQPAPTPFRASHAIYVRKDVKPAQLVDEVPALFATRTLGLRGFDEEGMMRGALLAPPGEAEAGILELFRRKEIAEVHVHTAALGCFLARAERN